MNIIEAIKNKRAVRNYAVAEVPLATIKEILDAGRRAQSSRNTQPTRFIVVRQKEILGALSNLGNYAAHLAKASFGVALATPDPSQNASILFDAGQAAAYLQLAALEYGVASCIVKLHRGEQAAVLLGIPVDYNLTFMIAFGYPSQPEALTRYVQLDRLRIEQVAYLDQWGVGFS